MAYVVKSPLLSLLLLLLAEKDLEGGSLPEDVVVAGENMVVVMAGEVNIGEDEV